MTMNQKSRIAAAALLSLLLLPVMASAQNDNESYEDYKKRVQKEYIDFKEKQNEEYQNFRKKANEEYASFLKKYWEGYSAFKGEKPPVINPVPPIVCPDDDRRKERENEVKPFEEIVVVKHPKPQPRPVEPIVPKPQPPEPQPQPVKPIQPIGDDTQPSPKPIEPVKPVKDSVSVLFYGTMMQYYLESKPHFSLDGTDESSISNAWRQLSNCQFDGLLVQCLNLRERFMLNDWAYIQLLDKISVNIVGSAGNKATLLMAWLYCQSGYMMRLARSNNQMYMLYASDDIIYDCIYYSLGGKRFYPYKGEGIDYLNICNVPFPNEQTMTLEMCIEPFLSNRISSQRILQSKRYPSIKVTCTVNQNLIDFYNDYPTGAVNNEFGTRWAIYANTPLSEEATMSLYPELTSLLIGKDRLEATEELLNFVQTAFVYEYDDTVWGDDRGFFAEETLFYPYSDCEDRSILFSRLVRDLLGLKVVLIYYPNHLATAVKFEEQQPKGDYLALPDGNYFIADPTYSGATVGMSMPSMRDKNITVIQLR